ncbi:uncharacterized protein LOC111479296 [Cucurbita maxima]|uniref:Uncharacterized protein LOC111479296 n=1 Tax=Cucurbita maxima TaxID=3661 RepID=A0A6J1IRA9_CUCMA|nr:uncharacterized protein LOC111479296 [Cucurbita maxima]
MKSSILLLMVIAPAFISTFLTNYDPFCIFLESRELALAFAFTVGGGSAKNRQVVSKWKRRLSIAIDSSALDLTILVDDDHDLDDRDSQASIDIGRALAINHPPKTDHVSIHIIDDALAGDDSQVFTEIASTLE